MADVPFAVECSCGGIARGARRARHQLVPCPACGTSLFVFPLSPALPALLDRLAPSALPRIWLPHLPPRVAFWFAPVTAAALALCVVGIVIAAVLRQQKPSDGKPTTEARAGGELAATMARFPDHCDTGSYHLAVRELDAACELLDRFPRALPADKALQLRRWRKQAALVADLVPESLSEIVRHAAGLDGREWKAVFAERYRGKAVTLDTKVTRTPGRGYAIDYWLDDAGRTGEWDFQDLALLHALNLQKTERLIFGVRLAEVERVGRDRWVVKPTPDGGVLFTEPAVFAQLSIPVDDDLRAQLRKQAEWED
ncbi:MAG: hypothetical protein U0746_21245 [Gemmataceae bacterium]